MLQPRVPIQKSCAILALLMAAYWPIGPLLSAREIPDVLGNPQSAAEPEPRTGGQNPPAPQEVLRREPQSQPKTTPREAGASRELLPGAMRKSLVLPDGEGYWIARWIHPDGEESGPIPLWIDREGNGHFLLQATAVQGEDRPLLIRAPRFSACQVLSLFRVAGGTCRAVASDVWIQRSGQTGETEYLPTGKGGWRSATALTAARNAFSPFESVFRHAEDPTLRGLASFRWPDVVLIHFVGRSPLLEETEGIASNDAGAE